MNWFSKRTATPLKSDEYETLFKRHIELEQRVRRLELAEDDFRNKVLRKIQERNTATENNMNQSSLVKTSPPQRATRRLGGKSAGLLTRG